MQLSHPAGFGVIAASIQKLLTMLKQPFIIETQLACALAERFS